MNQSATGGADAIRVVHRTSRRFRLKLPAEARSPGQLTGLRDRLASTPGVTDAEVNCDTGSILVQHDPGLMLEDVLERVGLTEQVLVDALPPRLRDHVRSEGSHLAQSLSDWFFDLDARLSRGTGGWLDLKMAIPLGLFSAAGWRFAAEGLSFFEVPPYLLLWYSFDTFVKLHQPQVERPAVPAARVGRAGRLRPDSGRPTAA